MNIFDSLKGYEPKFQVAENRVFNAEEKAEVISATVRPSQWGFSVCFIMRTGCKKYIPVSKECNVADGDPVDINTCHLLTLTRGEETIYRISI